MKIDMRTKRTKKALKYAMDKLLLEKSYVINLPSSDKLGSISQRTSRPIFL